ncbi:MAG: YcaO-like family protein [Bacteroidales bacterium]|jgi:YcaO-like protein with predicted kinase domain|nr:YcaO-like family protein [Bacteroidales bacterium]MCI1784908.1 YcaO-like family protein [Bacteroidales bacterium]
MKLKNSPKIFENYKSDIPENTIKNIEDGFGRLGLELKYIPDKNVNGINVFKGVCKANHTFIKTCGKGETPVLAKASAYAEMAERISSGFFFESVRNLNRRKDLFRNIKIDEEAFAKLKKHEFIAGYCYEKTGDSRNILPEQFIPNTPLQLKDRNILLTSSISKHHWVNGYSLSRNENVKVPIKFVFEIGWTTGQASGNTFEEAIAQGSCEIFERYCFSYVMHRRIPVPTIDLNTIKNPKIKQQISFYNEHNIEVVIKDFSLGNRFPVVGILFIDHNIENERNILKKDKFFQLVNPGSALNIEEAISRCFTERNQAVDPRLFSWTDAIWKHWVLNMGKDYRGAYANHNDSRHYLNDGDLSFLTDNKSRVISFDNLKDTFPRHTDFYDDVKYILDICKKENKELIIVNTQHSKIRFPSVWVVIPEMMWIHEGLKNENSVFLDYSLEDSWLVVNMK